MSSLRYSKRLMSIPSSATVLIADKTLQLRHEGVNAINLAGGDPDFSTPEHIIAAANRSMEAGNTHYTSSRGIPKLLEAISSYVFRQSQVKYDPRSEILVTPSGKYALFLALSTLLDPGDEVLVLEPAWVSFDPLVRLTGARPVAVNLNEANGFVLEEAQIQEAVTARTRMIIINSPNNPTGHVMSRRELEIVAAVAERANLLVVSDETYDQITYDEQEFTSFLEIENMYQRTILVNSFSKTYAMTGWRLGYLAAPKELVSPMLNLLQHSITCVAPFLQEAGAAALTGPQDFVQTMLQKYDERRSMVFQAINSLNGVSAPMPQGTFYLYINISETGLSDTEFCLKCLEDAHVALTPGSAFSKANGTRWIRLSFAASDSDLTEAMKRLADRRAAIV